MNMNFFKQYDTNVIGISDELNKDQLSLLLRQSIDDILYSKFEQFRYIFTSILLPEGLLYFKYIVNNSIQYTIINIIHVNNNYYCYIPESNEDLEAGQLLNCCVFLDIIHIQKKLAPGIYFPIFITNPAITAQTKGSCLITDTPITMNDISIEIDKSFVIT